MTNPFQPGDVKITTYLVRPEDFADFGPSTGGLVHQVFSTFALGREFEWVARLFMLDMKAADEESIGAELVTAVTQWLPKPGFCFRFPVPGYPLIINQQPATRNQDQEQSNEKPATSNQKQKHGLL